MFLCPLYTFIPSFEFWLDTHGLLVHQWCGGRQALYCVWGVKGDRLYIVYGEWRETGSMLCMGSGERQALCCVWGVEGDRLYVVYGE